MQLRRYTHLLVRGLWLILLFIVLGAAAGLVISLRTTPIYESDATVLIDQSQSNPTQAQYQDLLAAERLSRTYARLMTSEPVLDQVITNLNLRSDAATLGRRVTASVLRDTQLISVNVQNQSPTLAAGIANEIIKVFSDQSNARQSNRYAAPKKSLETEIQSIQGQINSSQSQLDALRKQGADFNKAEQDRLETLLAGYRTSAATLVNKLEDIRLLEGQGANNLVIVQAAKPQDNPVTPRPVLNTLFGALLGFILAIVVVFVRDYLDDTIKSSEEISQVTGLPGLGLIGLIEGTNEAERTVAITDTRSPIAEAYRVLAANIEFVEVDKPIHTIVVNSGGPWEGKSITAANLAVTLAAMGKRVIAIDGDLRKPTLHKYFGQPNARGVTTALLNHDEDIEEHLVPTGVENLMLMPSGPIPPNPTELIGSNRMSELFEKLRSRADIVIIDSPPSLVVADASLIARSSDATLLVVRAGTTRVDNLRRTYQQLSQSGTHMVGYVLNSISAHGTGYGYGYGYGYYYYSSDAQEPATRLGRLRQMFGGNGHKQNGRKKAERGTPALTEQKAAKRG